MPELSDRIRAIRSTFRLSQREFGLLLNIDQSSMGDLERGVISSECWEKIIQFIEEEPQLAMALLSERIEQPLAASWPERFAALSRKIGITGRDLADLLSVTPSAVADWRAGQSEPRGCPAIIFWILESYAGIDPSQWPSILITLPHDVMTAERIKVLRQSLAMRQRDLAYLMHLTGASTISQWERGDREPGWCANLLLRLLEAMPGPMTRLLEQIPSWSNEPINPEKAIQIRERAGLTQLELARLLQTDLATLVRYEREGVEMGCSVLIYRLIEAYFEEFLRLIQSLYGAE